MEFIPLLELKVYFSLLYDCMTLLYCFNIVSPVYVICPVQVYHAFYKPLEFTVAERDASQCYIKVRFNCSFFCFIDTLNNCFISFCE